MLRSLVGSEMCIRDRFMGVPDIRQDWTSFERRLRGGKRDKPDLGDFSVIPNLNAAFTSLLELEDAPANIWAKALAQTAEALASTPDQDGAARLWVNDSGEKAAKLIEELMSYAHPLPSMDIKGFARLFGNLMRGKVCLLYTSPSPRDS